MLVDASLGLRQNYSSLLTKQRTSSLQVAVYILSIRSVLSGQGRVFDPSYIDANLRRRLKRELVVPT